MNTFGNLSRRLDESANLAGFIDAILQNRLDATNYLVLADFLDEQGDPLAELIRLAVHLHQVERNSKQWTEAWDRFNTLGREIRLDLDKKRTGVTMGRVSSGNLYIQPDLNVLRDQSKSEEIDVRTLTPDAQRAVILAMVRRAAGTRFINDPQDFIAKQYIQGIRHVLGEITQMVDRFQWGGYARKRLPQLTDQIEYLLQIASQYTINLPDNTREWLSNLCHRTRQQIALSDARRDVPKECKRLLDLVDQIDPERT